MRFCSFSHSIRRQQVEQRRQRKKQQQLITQRQHQTAVEAALLISYKQTVCRLIALSQLRRHYHKNMYVHMAALRKSKYPKQVLGHCCILWFEQHTCKYFCNQITAFDAPNVFEGIRLDLLNTIIFIINIVAFVVLH